jgi:hypothetical protein
VERTFGRVVRIAPLEQPVCHKPSKKHKSFPGKDLQLPQRAKPIWQSQKSWRSDRTAAEQCTPPGRGTANLPRPIASGLKSQARSHEANATTLPHSATPQIHDLIDHAGTGTTQERVPRREGDHAGRGTTKPRIAAPPQGQSPGRQLNLLPRQGIQLAWQQITPVRRRRRPR